LGPPDFVVREVIGDGDELVVVIETTNDENLKLLCWHHHCQQHIHDAQTRTHNTNRDP